VGGRLQQLVQTYFIGGNKHVPWCSVIMNICSDCVQVSYISNSRKQIQGTAELVKVIGTTDHPL
jgi:hypothetical protein